MAFAEFISWLIDFATPLGYFGVFLVSLIGNLTIVLPLPAFILVFTMGSILNPTLVALAAAAGGTIGEASGYAIGLGGGTILKSKYGKLIGKTKGWIEKHGIFPVLVLFAATPLPEDLVGILCGVIKYDIKRFFLAIFIGKVVMNMFIAWAGFYGLAWILGWLGVG